MSERSRDSRRRFIKKAFTSALISGSSAQFLHAAAGKSQQIRIQEKPATFTANDRINIAAIGMGIMGFQNARVSLSVPGVQLIAVCDLYNGRLDRSKEVFGNHLFTTRDFREILNRKDIDAVLVSTTDHWHEPIAREAMNSGKHVYCEKPMVHRIEEGQSLIEAQRKTGKVLQVGSQYVSSIVTRKAKELFDKHLIGDLVLVETWMDRHSANGAWQYSIPRDASTSTVDWDRFLGNAPKQAFDPVRFFRWRNFRDYGTGIAGDLFVHLFSAIHTITGAAGPERIFCTGGLRYWKDGRDAPDISMGLYDYPATPQHPAFNLQMRVNFTDGGASGDAIRLIGTDGVIEITGDRVRLKRNSVEKTPSYGGWDSFDTFTLAQQREFEKWHRATYPEVKEEPVEDIAYTAPEGYSANIDHHQNFYDAIRGKAKIAEDAVFGLQAAGPALASNKSLFEKKVVYWDPSKPGLVNRK